MSFCRFSSPILSKCLSGYRTWPSPWKQPLSSFWDILTPYSSAATILLFFFFSFLKMIIWLALKLFFCYNVLLFQDICPPPKDFRGGVMFFTKAKMQWQHISDISMHEGRNIFALAPIILFLSSFLKKIFCCKIFAS